MYNLLLKTILNSDDIFLLLLPQLLGCLCRLLSVQEGAVWSESSTMTTFNGLLSFVVHSKPKVCMVGIKSLKYINLLKILLVIQGTHSELNDQYWFEAHI